jgi:NAD(P)-dependent dehydrogenase (short-subunit alcohol dehydrogenase family)
MGGAALITGGARRVGREIALMLASIGYDVALHHNATAPAGAVEEILAKGVGCEAFKADLSIARDVEALVPAVLERFKNLSVLVNNASIFERASIEETSIELLDRHLGINLKAPFMLSRDFKRLVGSGSIINVTDASVGANSSAYAAYLLSKKALGDFTRMAAREFGPAMRVNAVAPGLILEPPGESGAYLDRLAAKTPLKRRGHPSDVASAVKFLLENDYITGETIMVDGGRSL